MFSAQDQIIIYNETFRYVYEKYGYEALKDLWYKMSVEWCVDLDRLAAEKGLAGAWEYWCGDAGTLELEQADYNMTLEDDVLYMHMDKCPSLAGEVIDRGFEVFSKYCEHCSHLYPPILEKYGFSTKWLVEFDIKTMLPIGRCRMIIEKAESCCKCNIYDQ